MCQRCGRTVCAECQTQAAVGVHCPECVREARESAPRTRPAAVTTMRRMTGAGAPVVTYLIMALCVVVFLIEVVTGQLSNNQSPVYRDLAYLPFFTESQPWTIFTSLFVHASLIHIAFNMYSLFILGPEMERLVGRLRFVVLFLLSGFGGSLAVLLINPAGGVVGASGAIFGLFGAYFVVVRHLGGNSRQLLIVILINVVIGFLVPQIAWQAHLGGLAIGALIGLVYVKTRDRSKRSRQIALVSGIAAALIILTAVGVALLPLRFANFGF